MDDKVTAALKRIPQLSGLSPDTMTCTRLGGLTNLVYRLEVGAERYVLRIPGAGTEDDIDRKVEGHNARIAADAGVSAEVLFFDDTDGLMLARHLDDCVTMSPESFKSRPGAPARAAAALKQLHGCGQAFQFRFELFSMIDEYLALLAKLEAPLPEGYHDVVAESGAVRQALDAGPAALAPCHCDPLAENFLDDGKRMWIVD